MGLDPGPPLPSGSIFVPLPRCTQLLSTLWKGFLSLPSSDPKHFAEFKPYSADESFKLTEVAFESEEATH